jgi:hypothetical protein
MTRGRLPLPEDFWPKAHRYMRALRRGLLSYWYATLEGKEAATIEAATATWYVNILDKAVFEEAHPGRYAKLRADDRLGRVVKGLELIRDGETHAPVVVKDLLVESHRYGVPLAIGGQVMRSVFKWAERDTLPKRYLERDAMSSVKDEHKRATSGARHAYKDAVGARQVIETLFDAIAFFESLDARLVGPPAPPLQFAFAEVPAHDEELEAPSRVYLARPLGLDSFEPFLPDLACRTTERLTAQWPAGDKYFKLRKDRAKKELPAAPKREVRHIVLEDGKIIGYSGVQPVPPGSSVWTERCRQVWQDVRQGYRYFIVHGDAEIDLLCAARQQVCAPLDGRDLLAELPPPKDPRLDFDRLTMAETYPDVYLEMRIGRPIG